MGRRKKTLHDYAAEFPDLAVRRHLIERSDSGETSYVETLYCKSCELPMRVRRDRILEHLASGRHYRNQRMGKQPWNRAPVMLSAVADPDGGFSLPIDSAHPPQPSFALQGSVMNAVSTSNLVPSPPPPRQVSSLSGHQSAISSTTSLLCNLRDPGPSSSSSSYSSLHIQNPAVSSRQSNQRPVISEVSHSPIPGPPVSSTSTRSGGIGLAVIGVGHGSQALLKSLTEQHGCHLHYIIETRLSDVENAFTDGLLTNTRVLPEQEVDIALADQRVSAIVICSPPGVAAVMTLEALQAGKAVLCENLLSTSQQMVEACFDEAERRGKPLLCGFYKRFDPALKYLYKKLHESSCLGRLQRLSAVSRIFPAPPLSRIKMSGGIFYSAALHDIDLVNWLLGVSAPDTVFSLGHSFCSDMAAMKDADTVTISMKLSNGAIVSLDISQHCTKTCDQRLELYGCQGSLRLDNPNPLGITETPSSPSISQTHQERYQEAYRELFLHFIRTVKGKERPAITKEQYLGALHVAEAAEKSWRSGSAVDMRNEAIDFSIVKTEVM